MFVVPEELNTPLHLVLDIARSDDAGFLSDDVGAPPTWVVRDPQDPERVLDGSFRWSYQVQRDLAEIDRASSLREIVDLLERTAQRFAADSPWEQLEAKVIQAVAGGRGAVITVRLHDPELQVVPWEFLPVGGRPACAWPNCTVRNTVPAYPTSTDQPEPDRTDPMYATEPDGPGRIVMAWSDAGGEVPAAEHVDAIHAVAAYSDVDFDPRNDVQGFASLQTLAELLDDDVSVLHLLAVAAPLPGTTRYGLVLHGPDPDAPGVVVTPHQLAEVLRPHAGHLSLVVLSACQGPGTPANRLGPVGRALHEAGIPAVVASRFPLSPSGSVRVSKLLYRRLLIGLESVENAFQAAVVTERRAALGADWAAMVLYGRPTDHTGNRPIAFRPWQGPNPYEPADSRLFFGRGPETAALLGRVRTTVRGPGRKLLVVAGSSASGKSSVVLAGLVPALARGEVPELHIDPERSLLHVRPGDAEDPGTLVQSWVQSRRPDAGALLVIADQLDEMFEGGGAGLPRDRQGAFLRTLWSLADPAREGTRAFVVAVLRAENLARLGELQLDQEGRRFDLVVLDASYLHLVRQPTPDELDAIARGPAGKVGLRFEDGLVARILEDVQRVPSPLATLALCLDRLWRVRRGHWLTHRAYEATGGLAGRLAAEVVEPETERLHPVEVDEEPSATEEVPIAPSLSPEDDDPTTQQPIMQPPPRKAPPVEMPPRPTAPDPVPPPPARGGWAGRALALGVIGALAVACLVLAAGASWLFYLQHQARAQLDEQVALRQAAEERAASAEAESRQTRDGLRVWRAHERALALPAVAAVLLREVEDDGSLAPDGGWAQAARALLAQPIPQRWIAVDHPVGSIAFDVSGERVITADEGGYVRFWTWPDGALEQGTTLENGEPLASVELSREGDHLLVLARSSLAWLWTLGEAPSRQGLGPSLGVSFHPTGTAFVDVWNGSAKPKDRITVVNPLGDGTAEFDDLRIKRKDRAVTTTARFGAYGKDLVVGWTDGKVEVYNHGGKRMFLRKVEGPTYAVDLSPGGQYVLAAGADDTGSVWVWTRKKGTPLPVLAHPAGVRLARFGTDDGTVLTVDTDGGVRLWAIQEGSATPTLLDPGPTDAKAVNATMRENVVMATYDDNTARAWRANAPDQPLVLRHPDPVTAAGLGPDGRRAVTAAGGRLYSWDLSMAGLPEDSDPKALLARLWEAPRWCPDAAERDTLLGVPSAPDADTRCRERLGLDR